MDTLQQELKHFLIEALNLQDISPADIGDDMALFGDEGLGLDSIDALELALSLKKRYGVVIEDNDEQARQHLRSINTLAVLVASSRS